MKNNRRVIAYVVCVALGIILLGLGYTEVIDEFWSGMGAGLLAVGVLRLIQIYKYGKDESYREKIEVETNDERNRFIRNKAWAWTGYLFILILGCSVIMLRVIGQDVLSLAASFAICLMVLLYWITYMILRRKY